MSSNPIVNEVLAYIKQEETLQETKPRTPVLPKKPRRDKKVFLLGV